MEQRTKYAILVAALTFLVLALRLAVSFQVDEPSYQGHFAMLQVHEIRESGFPRYNDPFSYQGREYEFAPFFYYLLTLFSFLLPVPVVLKLAPNLFLAALVPIVYLLGFRLTGKRGISLLAAFFAGFSPILFLTNINDATPFSLALPIFAAIILALFDLETHPLRALLFIVLLTLLSPLVWIVLLALLVYFVILAAERIKISAHALELALFTFLLACWYTLITYKEALHRYGFFMVARMLPQSVKAASFGDFTMLAILYAVGVVPLLLGSLALYHTAFELRSKRVFFVAAVGLVALLVGLLKLVSLQAALVLLSLVFAVLAAPGIAILSNYWRKSRFSRLLGPALVGIVCFFILTSLIPAIATGIYPGSSPSPAEYAAMDWLRTETPEESVVLATPKEGFLINDRAHRASVADEEYLLIVNPEEILADIDQIYMTPSTVSAVELLSRYNADYVLIGPAENARYSEFGAVLKDHSCFPIMYQNSKVFVLQVNCTLATEAR